MAPNTVKPVPIEYRYERKFLTTRLLAPQVAFNLSLNSYGFRESFPARFVNSIYYDSHDLRNIYDNIDGVAERTKIRVRWYGDLRSHVAQPVLEIKRKNGLAGHKIRHPLAAFEIGHQVVRDVLSATLTDSVLPRSVRETVHLIHPTLICRYRRRYFEAVGHAVRVTIDEQLRYHPAGGPSNGLDHAVKDYRSVVLELKYAPELEDVAQEISNQFPFRLSKSSKYVMGLQRLRGGF